MINLMTHYICFTIFYSGINSLHPPSISNYCNVDYTLLKVTEAIDRLLMKDLLCSIGSTFRHIINSVMLLLFL